MLKSMTVTSDYVRAAIQRALETDFCVGRAPEISSVQTLGSDYVLQFKQSPQLAGVAAPPVEVGDETTRARRRFAEA